MIKHELSDAVRDIAKRYRPENAIGLSPCDCDDLESAADALDSLAAENAKLRGEVEKLKDIIDARIGREINATEDMHDYSVRKREATVIRESFATWQKSRSQTPNGGEVGNG